MKTAKSENEWWWRNPEGMPFVYDEKTGTTTAKKGYVFWPCLGLPHAAPVPPDLGRQMGQILWNEGMEHNVYAYELARRANRSLLLPPFTRLSQTEQLFIFPCIARFWWPGCWPNLHFVTHRNKKEPGSLLTFTGLFATKKMVSTSVSGGDPSGPVWPGFSERGVSWNLHESNDRLVKAFLRFIEDERKRRGVPKPKPRARVRNQKRVRWQWLEFMDVADGVVQGTYGDSERSRVAKVRPLARDYLAKLRSALAADVATANTFQELNRAL